MVSVIVNSLLISALPLPRSRQRRHDGIVPGYHLGMSLVRPYTVMPLTVVPVLFGTVYRNALICGCRGRRELERPSAVSNALWAAGWVRHSLGGCQQHSD